MNKQPNFSIPAMDYISSPLPAFKIDYMLRVSRGADPRWDNSTHIVLATYHMPCGPDKWKREGVYSTGIWTTVDLFNSFRSPNGFATELGRKVEAYKHEVERARLAFVRERKVLGPKVIHGLAMIFLEWNNQLDWLQRYSPKPESIQKEYYKHQIKVRSYINEEAIDAEKTLVGVFKEYMASRKALINDDQFTRDVDEISTSTYKGNLNLWHNTSLYLEHIGRTNLFITEVSIGFITNFREWMRSRKLPCGRRLRTSTLNGTIRFLKRLCQYAVSKEYLPFNPLAAIRFKSEPRTPPKPFSTDELDWLELVELPSKERWHLDSWLVAAELCLHHADYSRLKEMPVKVFSNGVHYIHYPRKKQRGKELKLTVDITPRAERIIAKYGGVSGLFYGNYNRFCYRLKKIARMLELKDKEGKPLAFQFGLGRDSGLTNRALLGASAEVLKNMAAHSGLGMLSRYIHAPEAFLEQFVGSSVQAYDAQARPKMLKIPESGFDEYQVA